MLFPISEDLYNFDIFPKVFVKGKEAEIHIRPLGGRQVFEPGKDYDLFICALDQGEAAVYPTGEYKYMSVK